MIATSRREWPNFAEDVEKTDSTSVQSQTLVNNLIAKRLGVSGDRYVMSPGPENNTFA